MVISKNRKTMIGYNIIMSQLNFPLVLNLIENGNLTSKFYKLMFDHANT
jgi:hypothetical protein